MPPKKSPAPKKAKAAPPARTDGFGPPDWGNVLPPPIELVPTGNAKIDEALATVFTGKFDAQTAKLADKATDEQVIGMFRGNALVPARPFHDQKLVDALTPPQKRQRNKAYWAAEAAKHARECAFGWFVARLAKSPAGRAYLLDVAADGEVAGRVRGLAAHALRDAAPDDALWRQIGERLDPTRWVGTIDNHSSTYLLHTYTVGATGALIADAAAAYKRWVPLLDPSVDAPQASYQASAAILGIRHYIGEVLTARQEEGDGKPERDPTPCVPFIPHLIEMLSNKHTEHYAMFALERLPHDPRVTAAIASRIGPWETATYYGEVEVRLLARTSDPTYLPWLAAALGRSWMHWPSVFQGLANIGDPRGIAVIEAWLKDNDAPDRKKAAKPVLAKLRATGGDPTPEQRAEAIELLAVADPKKKQKKK